MNNFFIKRLQIEGGFLDGLDLDLENGLNTIIGARGTGKSTFIELIRYGLNVKGHTPESNSKALSHAHSVLKDGQVTLTLSNGNETLLLSRKSESELETKLPSYIKSPLIFSQTEVETIGLLSQGRLKLIDNFIENIDSFKEKELNTIANIDSISQELLSITNNIGEYEDKLLPLSSLQNELLELEKEEKKISEISNQAAEKSIELKNLSEIYSNNSLKLNYLKDFLSIESQWQDEIMKSINKIPDIPIWRGSEDIPISKLLEERELLKEKLINNLKHYKDNCTITENYMYDTNKELQNITEKGQFLRKEVDNLQKGAGEISRKCLDLRNKIKQLENIKHNLSDIKIKITKLQSERDTILNELESIRSERSNSRLKVCEKISSELSPKIRISIELSSQLDNYIQVLSSGLKGSGIQYNDIISRIAELIPPRELINIIEKNNIDDFISFIPITNNRASKIINILMSSVNSIATVLLDDNIMFKLNDGTEWKDFSELSTGQRCTVILPIILEHKDTILIIDQPEDHIDNAFIVDTLISTILRRKGKGQTIVTTHNANIPVLGKADLVAHLSSDGKRGYIQAEGALKEGDIVDTISRLMEGGKEAFKYRSDFYGV